jgi:hypothetical protein
MTAILNQWMVLQEPPKAHGQSGAIRLVGLVSGQPGVSDGSCVRTTVVSSAEGRHVVTKTGSQYILQEPHPEARSIMKNFDACSPLQGLV